MREIKAIQLWMAISRRPNLSDSTIHAFPHVIWLTKTSFTLFNNSMSTSLLLCSHSQTLLNASVGEQIYKYPCRCTPSISESCAKEERRTEKGAKLKQQKWLIITMMRLLKPPPFPISSLLTRWGSLIFLTGTSIQFTICTFLVFELVFQVSSNNQILIYHLLIFVYCYIFTIFNPWLAYIFLSIIILQSRIGPVDKAEIL